jgi:hypothetical protein
LARFRALNSTQTKKPNENIPEYVVNNQTKIKTKDQLKLAITFKQKKINIQSTLDYM